MNLNNIILVPTDFSDVCANAVEQAVKISEPIGFKVHIYHVINKDTKSAFKGSVSIQKAVDDKLNKITSGLMEDHNVNIDYSYEEGSIFDLIHKKAEAIGANVILLGTHGKKGMQHLFGSFALKVITQSQVPTLVVQKRKDLKFDNILLPINSFTEARQKVSYAINVAKRFNSTIHIYKEKVKEPAEEHRIEIIARQIADEFKKENITHSVNIADKGGDTAKAVLDYAVENSMDIIMILTELQIGTSYFNLGPWNEKIMFNEAQIPVICINPVETGQVFFDL